MRYGSVCSGIEAATCAWHPLGWAPQWFAEIDRFPSAVLAHRYPGVPNLGDFTAIGDDVEPIDLLVGGTPCQSFSVAGGRAGLDDPRGDLALEFLRLAGRTRARWVVWENVPGVLSSSGGRDFGAFLGALGELGYGFAYRVLDAQYTGLAQRRKRVFVVGYLGDWRRAAAVLFERASLSWDPPPSRSAGADAAGTLGASTAGRGGRIDADEAVGGQLVPMTGRALTAHPGGRYDAETEDFVVAFHATQDPISGPVSPALARKTTIGVTSRAAVRRLMPVEWERLQGLPDGYTDIPGASDAARYKAIGNSMAATVMNWLGRRIQMVEGGAA